MALKLSLSNINSFIFKKGAVMRVARSGAKHFHGWTTIIRDREASITLNSTTGELMISALDEPDVYGNVRYDYMISISREDLAEILRQLVSSGHEPYYDLICKVIQAEKSAICQIISRLLGSKKSK